MGLKQEQHNDKQRIDLIYDLMMHDVSLNELSVAHKTNYNTVRSIKNQYMNQEGETYKHQRRYTDINNVVLKHALRKDPTLAD